MATDLAVSRSFYEQYNAWPAYAYSECTVSESGELMQPLADAELFEKITTAATGYTYSRDVCVQFCYNKYLALECNCTSFVGGGRLYNPSLAYCSPTYATCETQFRFYEYARLSFFVDKCLSKCPLECNKAAYAIASRSFDFPGTGDVYVNNLLAANPSLVARRRNDTDYAANRAGNILQVRIFYETLAYTQVREEAKISVDTLVGHIGGHLHLFMGMSLLSFVEVFLVLLKFVNANLFFRDNNNNKSTSAGLAWQGPPRLRRRRRRQGCTHVNPL